MTGLGQDWDRAGLGQGRTGTGPGQGQDLDRDRTLTGLGQGRTGTGPGQGRDLDRDGTCPGPGPVHVLPLSRSCSGPIQVLPLSRSCPAPVLSLSSPCPGLFPVLLPVLLLFPVQVLSLSAVQVLPLFPVQVHVQILSLSCPLSRLCPCPGPVFLVQVLSPVQVLPWIGTGQD